MVVALFRLVELRQDLLGQNLTEFDTPLVEAVDVPDGTLSESDVLVVGDERTKSSRGDLLGKNAGGRSVAQEGLVGNEVLGCALSLDILRGLAYHQSLGLRKVVGCQHLLVLVVLDRVVRLGRKDEVGRNELSTLVQKLEE